MEIQTGYYKQNSLHPAIHIFDSISKAYKAWQEDRNIWNISWTGHRFMSCSYYGALKTLLNAWDDYDYFEGRLMNVHGKELECWQAYFATKNRLEELIIQYFGYTIFCSIFLSTNEEIRNEMLNRCSNTHCSFWIDQPLNPYGSPVLNVLTIEEFEKKFIYE